MTNTRGSEAAELGCRISDLRRLVQSLSPEEQARFGRMIHISESIGRLRPPDSMRGWILDRFRDLSDDEEEVMAAVQRQVIIKTTNLVTMEGALFNELRARRPQVAAQLADVQARIEGARGDVFCQWRQLTPVDVFGRVAGKGCITASNVAKYDAFHGVVIFHEHDPLAFDEESISDAIEVGMEWARRAMEVDPEAKYFFFMWNCLWRAGAGVIHGHAQVACTRDMHYAKVEQLRRQALDYRARHGASYFDDLVAIHRSLGLGWDAGDTRVVCSLTPVREKEVLLMAPGLTADLRRAIARVLQGFIHRLGVQSFNLAISMPPLGPAEEDWGGFPHLVRIVDRGDPTLDTADIGAMELYASSVISSDPFGVAAALKVSAEC